MFPWHNDRFKAYRFVHWFFACDKRRITQFLFRIRELWQIDTWPDAEGRPSGMRRWERLAIDEGKQVPYLEVCQPPQKEATTLGCSSLPHKLLNTCLAWLTLKADFICLCDTSAQWLQFRSKTFAAEAVAILARVHPRRDAEGWRSWSSHSWE